jgi:hypothetical protein
MDANMKADREERKEERKESRQRSKEEMKAGQDKMDSLRLEIKSNQANAEANMKIHMQDIVAIRVSAIEDKMEAIVHSILSE